MSSFPKTSSDNNYEKFVEVINENNLSGEDVLQIMTNYHGLCLMSDDFIENLEDEGYTV